MERLPRQQCIDRLRHRLLGLVDENHSICEVASRLGIFCRGFSQWSFEELKKHYGWLADHRPHITRDELERLANAWQLARQQVFGTQLACDTQSIERDTCLGFDGLSDEQLARFHEELCGERVEVIGAPEPKP